MAAKRHAGMVVGGLAGVYRQDQGRRIGLIAADQEEPAAGRFANGVLPRGSIFPPAEKATGR